MTRGPTVICNRGPIRAASAPDRADSASMITVIGSSEMPACRGVYPDTWMSWIGSRNSAPPSAPYTAKVTTLAALNWAEENRLSGIIGAGLRRSQTTNAASRTQPAISAASGDWLHPADGRPFDQPVGQPDQAGVTSAPADDVDRPGRLRIPGLGHVPQRHRHDEDGERQVDDEDQPPGDRLDQPAAEERADRAADAAQAGPGADRLAAVFGRGTTPR